MTLPSRLRAAIGIGEGDRLNASIQRGRIVLTPTFVIDRSKFPNADDEYTPAQRRAIGRSIAKSLGEYKQGRSIGPFTSHAAFIASLHKETGKFRAKKPNRTVR